MRFSLRTLFLIVSVLGVYLAVVFALPPIVSGVCLTLVTFIGIPVVVTGVVYDCGYSRTFWIGCATSAIIPLLMLLYLSFGVFLPIYSDADGGEDRTASLIFTLGHGLVGLSGGVAVAARWLIDKKNGNTEALTPTSRTILSRRIPVELESGE